MSTDQEVPWLVIDFTLSAQRAIALVLEDDPNLRDTTYKAPEHTHEDRKCRVVIYPRNSHISAHFGSSDAVDDFQWIELANQGSYIAGTPFVLWRRMLVAEAFRLLASSEPRVTYTAPNKARVVKINCAAP